VRFERVPHGIGQRRVVAQQHVRAAFENRHPQTVAAERVGHFDADIPGPNHHRAARLAIAQEGAQPFAIVERVQREHVRLIGARDGAGLAVGAGRQDQPVVADALARFEHDLAPRMRYGRHRRARAHVDVALLAEVLRRVDNEVGRLAHAPSSRYGSPHAP